MANPETPVLTADPVVEMILQIMEHMPSNADRAAVMKRLNTAYCQTCGKKNGPATAVFGGCMHNVRTDRG
jgi:hypothetical protein